MNQEKMRRLPDTEFEIMMIVWESAPPITTAVIMEKLGTARGWKAPTAISFLLRLVAHGFLRTEKPERERLYYPLVAEDDYLRFETERFVRTYHANSSVSFFNALIESHDLSPEELDELQSLIATTKKRCSRPSKGGTP